MNSLKIVHLFNHNKGSRYHAMISQGLYHHPDISVSYSMPFVSLGKVICPADKDIHKSMLGADYIFRCDDKHFGIEALDSFLDEHNLWPKVVYYDFKDTTEVDSHRLNQCAAYIKRSWAEGKNRIPLPPAERPVLPLDFSLLSEYFTRPIPENKDIDVSYLFPPDKNIGMRRYEVYKQLDSERHVLGNSRIGYTTAGSQKGRRAIFEPPENNVFLEYMDCLRRSKIVFTAFPDDWDGDSRVWEAFASGALVFMDVTAIPSPKPFIHGKHCYIYNAADPQSVRDAVLLARYLLKDNETRTAVAAAGYDHAKKFHQPVHRIIQALLWLGSAEKKLSDHVLTERNFYLRRQINYNFPSRESIAGRNRPLFLGIGAQKAGTSWVYENIRCHPQIFANPGEKELHFFNFKFEFGLEWYLKQFDGAGGRMPGEITPGYAILRDYEVEQIHALFPDLKVFYILRNPVERTISAAKMDIEREFDIHLDTTEVTDAVFIRYLFKPQTIARSDYLSTIRIWKKHFPEEQFRIMFYDDICKDPGHFLSELFRFLGVEHTVDLSQYPTGRRFLAGSKFDIPQSLRELLIDRYEPKIRELEDAVGLDLSEWHAQNQAGLQSP